MKTNLQVLNEISAKLEGEDNATSITEALNNIANALGDNNPDEIVSVSNSLEDILSVAGQGGGGEALKGKIRVKIVNSSTSPIVPYAADQEVPLFALHIDGGIYNSPASFVESIIMPNSEAYVDYICIGNNDGEDVITWSAFTNKMVSGQDSVVTKSITELVNCVVVANLEQIEITDPTLEASCTIEYEDAGN